ncbi:hypothetical protein [Nostoc sp. DSM 114159]
MTNDKYNSWRGCTSTTLSDHANGFAVVERSRNSVQVTNDNLLAK